MNSSLGEVYTEELLKLFQQQGSSLYNGETSLCLTSPCLHYLQKKFSAAQEPTTEAVPVRFASLDRLQTCLAKVVSMKLIADKQISLPTTATLNLEPFRALHTLVLKKVTLASVTGLHRLRSQLRVLVVQRCSVSNIDDVIVRCCGDDASSLVWSSLKELDLAHNIVSVIGDSLQYVPSVERVNFSHNNIGSGASEDGPLTNTEDNPDNSFEGILCLEKVTFLHLGFNKLRSVPRFATKVKYSLTLLSLRNNQLDNIEGIHELDSLIELDLTDNLLTKHNLLRPLKNLHHLSMLSLDGNPLSYHPKHRLRTAQNLSNLIDRNSFRLENRKLSAAEKKEISSMLTHYPGRQTTVLRSSTPISMTTSTLPSAEEGSFAERFSRALLSDHDDNQDSIVVKKPRKRRNTKTTSTSTDTPVVNGHDEPENLAVGSLPLLNEQRLHQIEQVRKQLEDDWMQSLTEDSLSTDLSTSQPDRRSSSKGLEGKTSRPKKKSRRNKKKNREPRPLEPEAVSGESEGDFGPKTSSPNRGPTPSNVEGEFFLVERYESDFEDDSMIVKGREQATGGRGQESHDKRMMLVLTERFLEEQTTQGKKIDRWDVNSLQEASITSRPCKNGSQEMSDVLFLKFNLDRRDRRTREYVISEDGVNDTLLGLLEPIVEQNKATLSVENRLECLKCQSVFDRSQAQDEPSLEPQPLGSHKNRSLSKLMCPYCSSQLLQIASFTKPAFKLTNQTSSPSLGTPPQSHPPNSSIVTPSKEAVSGFEITPPDSKSDLIPDQASDLNDSLDGIVEDFLTSEMANETNQSNEPSDLSPWNSEPVSRPDSRPRSDAVCESDQLASPIPKPETSSPKPIKQNSTGNVYEAIFNSVPKITETSEASKNPFDTPSTNPFDTPGANPFDNIPDSFDSNLDTESKSVPSGGNFDAYMRKSDNKPHPPQSSGHNRSKSMGHHPKQVHNTTPPSARKKYSENSLGSVKEGQQLQSNSSSLKSSLLSLDDRGSPISREASSQDISSGENSKRKSNFDTFLGPRHKYPSSDSGVRSSSGVKVQKVLSSGDLSTGRRKPASKPTSSSEERKKSITLIKEDDPTYIESSLNLYLDMEVFNLDKKERFQLVFKVPVVQYGHTKEMMALIVVSNLSFYIFRITAPENSDPKKWLELVANHLLRRLVFIDIGVGYQFLRVEFKAENACYTLLLRDEELTTTISTKLAFIVSDVAKSSFKTVGVCNFSMETLRHPKRALKEVIMVDYEQLSGRHTPTRSRTPTRHMRPGSSLSRSHDDDELVLYRLTHKRTSARAHTGPIPVSLVLSKTTIFLARENFTHWPLPRLQALPPKETLNPPYSDIQQRSITDIEQIVLDRDQSTQVTIRFFKEYVMEGEERYWCLLMKKDSCVDSLVAAVKRLWKEAFQTDLPVISK